MAIAHEWIAAHAGSEKVFERLAQIYPEADLYALTKAPSVGLHTSGRNVETTLLDRSSWLRNHRGVSLPLMPLAWRLAGRDKYYETVITSSHACVKGFWPARAARHYCYVHAPMRYVWSPEIDARGASLVAAPARKVLARWDLRSTRWVDSFAANSSAVAQRIRDIYDRDAVVIHPPVDVDFFVDAPHVDRHGFVTLGRLIPYKRHDAALRVAARLGAPITIIGRGPEERRLRELAAALRVDARFLTNASDVTVRDEVARARALLFPANEDFGIVPVEAQAAGTPVVGPAIGGLLDTVVPGVTGELAEDESLEAMTVAASQALAGAYRSDDCRKNALRFAPDRFARAIRAWLSDSEEAGRS